MQHIIATFWIVQSTILSDAQQSTECSSGQFDQCWISTQGRGTQGQIFYIWANTECYRPYTEFHAYYMSAHNPISVLIQVKYDNTTNVEYETYNPELNVSDADSCWGSVCGWTSINVFQGQVPFSGFTQISMTISTLSGVNFTGDAYFRLWCYNTSTAQPTNNPTSGPTSGPTTIPTNIPTKFPTNDPTNYPVNNPTSNPTNHPSLLPSNLNATISPTLIATIALSIAMSMSASALSTQLGKDDNQANLNQRFDISKLDLFVCIITIGVLLLICMISLFFCSYKQSQRKRQKHEIEMKQHLRIVLNVLSLKKLTSDSVPKQHNNKTKNDCDNNVSVRTKGISINLQKGNNSMHECVGENDSKINYKHNAEEDEGVIKDVRIDTNVIYSDGQDEWENESEGATTRS